MYSPFSLCVRGLILVLSVLSSQAFAHGVDANTETFLLNNTGAAVIPFLYVGAKHMITGYDHLLFLVGVVFFLYRSRDIVLYISLFTLGHSSTLLLGVLGHITINPYLIDAIIGLSVLYKGFDNLGGFQRALGYQPDTRIAVLVFGLFHGFGLASKLQDFELSSEGLLTNLIAFNVGVELGQLMALFLVLIVLNYWRLNESFLRLSTVCNTALMSGGLLLMGYQLTGYFYA